MDKVELNRYMESLPCPGCESSANPRQPVTDDHCRCGLCGAGMSGSYLHSCKTGWENRVCGKCNLTAIQSPATTQD